MAITRWTLKNYNLSGVGVTAADMTHAATISNQIKHYTNSKLGLALNGVDQLDFTLYLDDPMALQIRRLHNVVKVWRTVLDDDGSTIYADPSDTPCFAGVVSNTIKDGDANTMNITAMSPLWRLQSRFHLLNHYLKTNPDTGNPYTESEMIWKLIDLVNEAFGIGDSNTGITKGTFSAGSEITVAPMFIQKGSNTWTNIFDGIMGRAGSVDIVPRYHHTASSPRLMYLDTDEKRGTDNTAFSLNYHTGSNDNLDNLTEEETPIPGEFANYVWAVGHGGPNSGKIAAAENDNDDDDGYDTIGIYMRRADYDDETLIGVSGPPATHLLLNAQSELAQSRVPKSTYTATISPASDAHYESDFTLGDLITLNADKHALVVSGVAQRVYEVTLTNSDANIETVSLGLANDFTGKFV